MEWETLIDQELKKPYFQKLVTFLKKEDQEKLILPPKEDRLSCFKLTPYDQVKVVILGQDPYHQVGQAHGLSFSVKQKPFPPSLKNIFQEMVDDLKLETYPHTGNLTSWAKQGVLLLNTTLTVEHHKPLAHKDQGWEIFTQKVIDIINQKETPVVFILWGKHAAQFKHRLNQQKHLIITAPHPSPLSAYRGFFGSKPFSQTNDFLIKTRQKPIHWDLL